MRNLDIADSRAKLELYAEQPNDQGQLLVENGTLFGALPAGGYDRITDNPAGPRPGGAGARPRGDGVRHRLTGGRPPLVRGAQIDCAPCRPSPPTRPAPASTRAAGDLGAAAVRQMETDHEWFRALSAENRSWVGLVAQAGITSFIEWFGGDQERLRATARRLRHGPARADPVDQPRPDPRPRSARASASSSARSPGSPHPAREDLAREAVLRYSREVAFAAAEVYAEAAEARGAWDARLESLVVDAVIRGEADDSMQSRAAALGLGRGERGRRRRRLHPRRRDRTRARRAAPHRPAQRRRAARRRSTDHGSCASAAGSHDPMALAETLDPHLGDGPLVVGPDRARTSSPPAARPGPRSPGHTAAPAWPGAPPAGARRRPARRARPHRRPAGPQRARRPDLPAPAEAAAAPCWRPRRPGSTAASASRAPPAHSSSTPTPSATGSRGIARATGYDLTDPHDAQTVRIALAFHRLGPVTRGTLPPEPRPICGIPTNRAVRFVPARHDPRPGQAARWET